MHNYYYRAPDPFSFVRRSEILRIDAEEITTIIIIRSLDRDTQRLKVISSPGCKYSSFCESVSFHS